MLSRLRNYIHRQLDKQYGYSDDELYRMTIMLFVAVGAIIIYLTFAIFSGVLGCLPLTISHAIGVFVFIVMIFPLRRGRIDLAGIVMGLTIIFSSIVTIHTIGDNAYSILYLYFVLVMMMIVPFKSKVIRIISAVLIPMVTVSAHIYEAFTTPLYTLDAWVINTVAISNVTITVLGILLLIALQQFLKSVIDGYNSDNLKELQAQAYIDPLTKLYNRRYADIYISTLGRPSATITYIAVADIDDFKLINDTHGHDTGDVVLQIIAKIMKENTGKRNPVFRWGGEEFMAFLFDMNEHEAVECADKVRQIIQDTPMCVGNLVLRPTVTMGVAKLDFGAFEDCFAEADRNMYYGKQHGKNAVITTSDRISDVKSKESGHLT